MPGSHAPKWVERMIFTDHLRRPTPYRFDLIHAPGTVDQTVVMQRAFARLHSSLPLSELWTYDGHYPGPMVVLNQGQVIRVTWVNGIHGAYPVRVVRAEKPSPGAPRPQNEPGDSGATEFPAVPGDARVVVHLHGGQTQPDSDGWPENTLEHGQESVNGYAEDQAGTLLWYHDHAMGITRYNAYAGLAGLWIIRDPREKDLQQQGALPDESHELVLIVHDRNLETRGDTPDGEPTGRLLHKIDKGTGEFFGPFTVVNGTIWPHCHVEATTYRIRVVNGSNARTYGLELRHVDEHGRPTPDPIPDGVIRQIGTDGGLLPKAVTVTSRPSQDDQGVVLAPAERVDLLIDFGRIVQGKSHRGVAWFNTAKAPYDGVYVAPDAPEADREGNLLKYNQVIRFNVADAPATPPLTLPATLSTTYRRKTRAEVTNPDRLRLVALIEVDDPSGVGTMLQLRELVEWVDGQAEPPQRIGPGVYRLSLPGSDVVKRYVVAARNFFDTVNFMVDLGETQEWKFLNMTPDAHPIHVHQIQFQLLDRARYVGRGADGKVIRDPANPTAPRDLVDVLDSGTGFPAAGSEPIDEPSAVFTLDDGGTAVPADENSADIGEKDTIRVRPNELVSIVGLFAPYAGRYVYHCHVIEHEDHDMMRPFVVMAGDPMTHPHVEMPSQPGGRPGVPPR